LFLYKGAMHPSHKGKEEEKGMLDVKGITKRYGKHTALNDCGFTVRKHEVLGVCGENGSGKTTLFRCLMGLCAMDEGEIRFEGQLIPEGVRHNFGYLPEQRSLYTDLSIEDTLIHYGRLRKMGYDQIDRRIRELYTNFDFKIPGHTKLNALSKGNQQKVQFMAALIHDPDVVILDEPFTGLDYMNLKKTQDFLLELARQGKCILISSHQYEELDAICTSLLILRKGITKGFGNLDRMKTDEGSCTIRVNASVNVIPHIREDEPTTVIGNAIHIQTKTPQRAKRLLNLLSREEETRDLSMERIKVKELIKARCDT